MTLPTYETIKLITSHGRSPSAVGNLALATGVSIGEIEYLVTRELQNPGFLAEGVAALKADRPTYLASAVSLVSASGTRENNRAALICAARGAYLIATARTA